VEVGELRSGEARVAEVFLERVRIRDREHEAVNHEVAANTRYREIQLRIEELELRLRLLDRGLLELRLRITYDTAIQESKNVSAIKTAEVNLIQKELELKRYAGDTAGTRLRTGAARAAGKRKGVHRGLPVPGVEAHGCPAGTLPPAAAGRG